MIYIQNYSSPLGDILLAEKDSHLAGLWIDGQKHYLSTLKDKETQKKNTPLLQQASSWLDRYFAGDRPAVSEIPLMPEGTDFRQSVWKILCEIPYGETTTYGEIAKQLACGRASQVNTSPVKMSARAVGGAVAHNPISIIIPCHRVIGAKGKLTGYAGGLDKKIWLLAHESPQSRECASTFHFAPR